MHFDKYIYTHSQHLCEDTCHRHNSRTRPFVVSTPLPHLRVTLTCHGFVLEPHVNKRPYTIHTYLCLAFMLNIT